MKIAKRLTAMVLCFIIITTIPAYGDILDVGRYRPIFHNMPAPFGELVGMNAYLSWEFSRTPQERWNECVAVSFIKYFNISKEDFAAANEQLRESWASGEISSQPSSAKEIYPVDLIFTFNNELINEFFLWENSSIAEERGLGQSEHDHVNNSPSPWAVEQVFWARAEGLVPTNLQSNYTQAITRAEFCSLAVVVYERVKGEITARTTFIDTDDVNVEKAASVGIVSGVGDNRFDPNGTLIREQAAVMLSNLADAFGQPFPKQAATFADNNSASSWALDGIGKVQAAGIMSGVGDSRFAPKQQYTREQSIITILQIFEVMQEMEAATQISEHGRQAAENFLSGYLSLFSLGWHHNDTFYRWGSWSESEVLDEVPLVYVEFEWPKINWYDGAVYDRGGNLFPDDVPFLNNTLIADLFWLYDFDDDGIPEILIRYTAETWSFTVLYKYVDGKYRDVLDARFWPSFYTDDYNRVIMVEADHGDTWASILTFTEEGVEVELHTGISVVDLSGNSPQQVDLSGLIEIEPLITLKGEIFDSIKGRIALN